MCFEYLHSFWGLLVVRFCRRIVRCLCTRHLRQQEKVFLAGDPKGCSCTLNCAFWFVSTGIKTERVLSRVRPAPTPAHKNAALYSRWKSNILCLHNVWISCVAFCLVAREYDQFYVYFQSSCEHTDAFSRWQNTEMTSNTDPMTSRLLRSFRGEPYGNRAPATLSGIWRLPYEQKCTICFYRSDREQRIVDMSVEASSPVRFAKKLPLIRERVHFRADS